MLVAVTRATVSIERLSTAARLKAAQTVAEDC